jgi:cell division protein FtsZ
LGCGWKCCQQHDSRENCRGVKFITSNTDAQALSLSLAEAKIQLGFQATQGLGAGSHPEVGKASAEESIEDVLSHIEGSNMLFVTAGMGGGTGTGAAPVIAKAAREKGILTIGVVTKPFHFEGSNRMRTAERGINELQQYVDTLIIIPNQNLFRVANEKTTFADAFKMADDVLYSGVRSITDLMMKPGLINLDFADVRAVMGGMMGKAMMGTGEAQGEGRAIEAAEAAISSPLLDDVSMPGAKAILINITGGLDMTLYEVDEAANRIREEVDPDAHIIFGSTFDESLQGRIRVSCVATGIDSHAATSLNKSRISDLEKEMQIAASLRAEQETSLESHLGNKEHAVFSAEMENPENIIKFTEFETPSPYSDERPQKILMPTRRVPQRKKERPLGFFERLMGENLSLPAQPSLYKDHVLKPWFLLNWKSPLSQKMSLLKFQLS